MPTPVEDTHDPTARGDIISPTTTARSRTTTLQSSTNPSKKLNNGTTILIPTYSITYLLRGTTRLKPQLHDPSAWKRPGLQQNRTGTPILVVVLHRTFTEVSVRTSPSLGPALGQNPNVKPLFLKLPLS